MSTATIQPAPAIPHAPFPTSGRRLLTAADIAAFPTALPTGDVRWELYDGEPIPMSPPGFVHSKLGLRLAAALFAQGEQRGLGEAGDECGIILRRTPDRVVGADAVFVLNSSLPAKVSPEGYLETIPQIVVEVRSKNDTTPEVDAKVGEYHTAGVELVWVVDPVEKTVSAHRAGQPPTVFATADTLTDVLLPGFAVPVDRLFAGT